MLALDHQILKNLRNLSLNSKTVIVAVSGGIDSVCLLGILNTIQSSLKLKLVVVHVHHGVGLNSQQNKYRLQAYEFVKNLCKTNNYTFESNYSEDTLDAQKEDSDLSGPSLPKTDSEASLREYRYSCIAKVQDKYPNSVVALAHHFEDQVETMFINMIRGSGALGLSGMSLLEGYRLRPLLTINKQEIVDYCEQKTIEWIKDPSNESLDPLRNWLRNDWLLKLEQKCPGAKLNIFKSVGLLKSELQTLDYSKYLLENSINYPKFLELNFSEKKSFLAYYMKRLNLQNYGQGHIEEVIKRLDTSKKTHNFRLLKRQWMVSPQSISVR